MFDIKVPEDVLKTYNELKMKRAHRWIIFKVVSPGETLAVESVGEPTSTFADFVAKMPKEEARYDSRIFC